MTFTDSSFKVACLLTPELVGGKRFRLVNFLRLLLLLKFEAFCKEAKAPFWRFEAKNVILKQESSYRMSKADGQFNFILLHLRIVSSSGTTILCGAQNCSKYKKIR